MTTRELNEALTNRDVAKLEQCLADKVSPNYHDSSYGTALFRACNGKWLQGVNILIAAGADLNKGTNPNFTSNDNESPLFKCVQGQWADGVKALLKAGADVNLGVNGSSAGGFFTSNLFNATEATWVEGVQLLVDGGHDLQKGTGQFKSDGGFTLKETALHMACKKQEVNIIKILLAKGAHVIKDADARYPDHYLWNPAAKEVWETEKAKAASGSFYKN